MLLMVINTSSVTRTLLVFCLLLPLTAGSSDNGKKVGKPLVNNLPFMYFRGEWRTREGTSPTISIVFYDRSHHIIKINNKLIEMTGGRLPKPAAPAFFHFRNLNFEGPYGGESYKDLGLVNGMVGSKEVLSGFYSEIDHNSEGEIIRGFSVPVVLYPVKTGVKKK